MPYKTRKRNQSIPNFLTKKQYGGKKPSSATQSTTSATQSTTSASSSNFAARRNQSRATLRRTSTAITALLESRKEYKLSKKKRRKARRRRKKQQKLAAAAARKKAQEAERQKETQNTETQAQIKAKEKKKEAEQKKKEKEEEEKKFSQMYPQFQNQQGMFNALSQIPMTGFGSLFAPGFNMDQTYRDIDTDVDLNHMVRESLQFFLKLTNEEKLKVMYNGGSQGISNYMSKDLNTIVQDIKAQINTDGKQNLDILDDEVDCSKIDKKEICGASSESKDICEYDDKQKKCLPIQTEAVSGRQKQPIQGQGQLSLGQLQGQLQGQLPRQARTKCAVGKRAFTSRKVDKSGKIEPISFTPGSEPLQLFNDLFDMTPFEFNIKSVIQGISDETSIISKETGGVLQLKKRQVTYQLPMTIVTEDQDTITNYKNQYTSVIIFDMRNEGSISSGSSIIEITENSSEFIRLKLTEIKSLIINKLTEITGNTSTESVKFIKMFQNQTIPFLCICSKLNIEQVGSLCEFLTSQEMKEKLKKFSIMLGCGIKDFYQSTIDQNTKGTKQITDIIQKTRFEIDFSAFDYFRRVGFYESLNLSNGPEQLEKVKKAAKTMKYKSSLLTLRFSLPNHQVRNIGQMLEKQQQSAVVFNGSNLTADALAINIPPYIPDAQINTYPSKVKTLATAPAPAQVNLSAAEPVNLLAPQPHPQKTNYSSNVFIHENAINNTLIKLETHYYIKKNRNNQYFKYHKSSSHAITNLETLKLPDELNRLMNYPHISDQPADQPADRQKPIIKSYNNLIAKVKLAEAAEAAKALTAKQQVPSTYDYKTLLNYHNISISKVLNQEGIELPPSLKQKATEIKKYICDKTPNEKKALQYVNKNLQEGKFIICENDKAYYSPDGNATYGYVKYTLTNGKPVMTTLDLCLVPKSDSNDEYEAKLFEIVEDEEGDDADKHKKNYKVIKLNHQNNKSAKYNQESTGHEYYIFNYDYIKSIIESTPDLEKLIKILERADAKIIIICNSNKIVDILNTLDIDLNDQKTKFLSDYVYKVVFFKDSKTGTTDPETGPDKQIMMKKLLFNATDNGSKRKKSLYIDDNKTDLQFIINHVDTLDSIDSFSFEGESYSLKEPTEKIKSSKHSKFTKFMGYGKANLNKNIQSLEPRRLSTLKIIALVNGFLQNKGKQENQKTNFTEDPYNFSYLNADHFSFDTDTKLKSTLEMLPERDDDLIVTLFPDGFYLKHEIIETISDFYNEKGKTSQINYNQENPLEHYFGYITTKEYVTEQLDEAFFGKKHKSKLSSLF